MLDVSVSLDGFTVTHLRFRVASGPDGNSDGDPDGDPDGKE